ncbi:sce7725 family protein [Desulfuribacillus alkaliarsenatis]|uniref:Sce7725 family protein n=1 Tax=Desulfuribacillus alkaliarsenatis TaxID=766136 RepID=A0A1E5G468_9FIRM|nr:sce7725 family protein [Desulfuribacillus alkaliarsenatis]OEF97872.1 hypothetical protein BHF68_13685 [Desulfuribacillus alkaliarsenatis]
MYFPCLRGRQFELIALRELLEKSLLSKSILPIVEPVKLSSTLIKTIQAFEDYDSKLALVINPTVGSFNSDCKNEKNTHNREKLLEMQRKEFIINAYHINPAVEKLIKTLQECGEKISNIISICENEDYITIYEKLFNMEKPVYNLIPDERIFLRRIRENIVMMDDRFKKKTRNVDYIETEDEPFSSDHLYYSDDGYVGFSDYSIIGNEYTETGFAPYAVAIHIVYFDNENRLRVRHFVSDTNEDITNPAGKFAEALQKLVDWNKSEMLNTYGINEFMRMYDNEIYPGLGTVKKLSLMHHLELIGRYLDGEI